MSRLIVKNLPKSITEDRLKRLFESRGCVTDCQLKFTKDGVFRRFAFVGFQTEAEAGLAMKYLDNTFVDSFKIHVEVCKPFGDETKPRAWSKYAKDSSAYQRSISAKTETNSKPENPTKTTSETKKEMKKQGGTNTKTEDVKFREFMALQGQQSVESSDVNDNTNSLTPKGFEENETLSKNELEMQLAKQKPPNETNFLIVHGLPNTIMLKNLKEFVAPVRLKTVKVAKGEKLAAALISFQRSADLRRLLKRSGEFFGGFKLDIKKPEAEFGVSKPAPNEQFGDSAAGSENAHERETATSIEAAKQIETIADTGRLFIRNLSYLCSTDDLESLLRDFGPLAEITMPIDKRNEKPKGYAVVTFVIPEHAVKAYSKLDGTIFQGRMLHIIAGKEKPGDEKEQQQTANLSEFKQKKIAALKAMAGKNQTWNSLFLGSAAVANALATQLNTEKSAILDSAADSSLGVRMALGETRLVKETRDFLMSNGVALDSFSRPNAPRSKTVILVKNLPAKTKTEELRKVFSRHGELGRLVLPPTGITGLVEYLDETEAKKAFGALAYSRFVSVPLYLEWAPGDVFSGAVVDKSDEKDDDINNEQPELDAEASQKESAGTKEEEKKEGPEAETELFVKNLNFNTTDDQLRKKFERLGPLYYATVAKKTDPKNAGKVLSMGFGFVQFLRAKDAQNALKKLQGSLLDGHSLELKMSQRESSNEKGGERKGLDYLEQGDSTKILVRNIPFQASQKEIRELFSAFGDIRSIRLPKKVGGECSHRGFAFVDFSTKATARQVFKALCHSTHLYGRRLVLEWAKEDETLDDVRKRTAEHFKTGEHRVKRAKERQLFLKSLTKAAGV